MDGGSQEKTEGKDGFPVTISKSTSRPSPQLPHHLHLLLADQPLLLQLLLRLQATLPRKEQVLLLPRMLRLWLLCQVSQLLLRTAYRHGKLS